MHISVMELPRAITRTSNLDDDENFKRTKTSRVIGTSIEKLTRKIFELETCEKMAEETERKLVEKKTEVVNEQRKLDELQYERLDRMEAFCDKIWAFSASNDLCATFDEYLDDVLKRSSSSRWKDGGDTVDLEQHDRELTRLRNENDELNERLTKLNSIRESLEENARRFETETKNAASYRENNHEIASLKKSRDQLREELRVPSMTMTKMEKKITSEEHQCRPKVDKTADDKSDFVTASELIKKFKMDETTKRSKFSVKKQSAISRKLSNMRETRCAKSRCASPLLQSRKNLIHTAANKEQ